MTYREISADLFSLPEEYMLVHCISSDFALGAGIARVFRDRYGVRDALVAKENSTEFFTRSYKSDGTVPLRYSWHDKGYCVFTETGKCKWVVANLVTKYRYFEKPTYKTMRDAIHDLKKGLLICHPNVKKVGMPLIGCGLDRLKWESISQIIQQQFCDTDIEIVVCRL